MNPKIAHSGSIASMTLALLLGAAITHQGITLGQLVVGNIVAVAITFAWMRRGRAQ